MYVCVCVTGSKLGTWKRQCGSSVVVIVVHVWQGCWQMHRQIMAFPLCMHSAFPTEK